MVIKYLNHTKVNNKKKTLIGRYKAQVKINVFILIANISALLHMYNNKA